MSVSGRTGFSRYASAPRGAPARPIRLCPARSTRESARRRHRIRAQLPNGLHPIHDRHLQIHEDDIDSVPSCQGQCLGAVSGFMDEVAGICQPQAAERSAIRGIIRDENAWRFGKGVSTHAAATCKTAAAYSQPVRVEWSFHHGHERPVSR